MHRYPASSTHISSKLIAVPVVTNIKSLLPLSLSHSCTRSLTVWRSSTRTRKRNWRRRRSPWTTSSTCSNRKRLLQSSCRPKLSRQGAPPHSRGTKRGKSKYCSLQCLILTSQVQTTTSIENLKSLEIVNLGGKWPHIIALTFQPFWELLKQLPSVFMFGFTPGHGYHCLTAFGVHMYIRRCCLFTGKNM